MAPAPLLTLSNLALGWGGAPLFTDVSLSVGRGERIALVGRNGSGKSTLLKVMAGLTAQDGGERWVQPGARIAYLAQDPSFEGFADMAAFVGADLPEDERYKAEIAMESLGVAPAADPARASGGERRRAAIARTLADEPDLLLLDEPTNHLDIAAIEALEARLAETSAGYVLISHDRALLTALTRATLWIDRGVARRLSQGFGGFEDWRDKVFAEEDAARHKLDQKIRREEHWITHGVSGRRKRNVRRVAELEALRSARRAAAPRPGAAAMALESGAASGKQVIEAKEIAKSFGARALFADFSVKIARGDRVAFVGPNGAGKTTLLNTLLGRLEPDAGSVRLGANLELALFDQGRAALDPAKSLWETLTEDALLGVKGSNDQVMVRGRPKHVVGYLKEFLFDERQARGPVSALSGGERARLLLARLLARESNLLALDEPTNDLDVETLDLLVELLADYDGTLLLVSHDRDFIDRVATMTIAVEGDGAATVYAGGWSDYRAQRAGRPAEDAAAAPTRRGPAKAPPPAAEKPEGRKKLGFKETRRLEALPAEIERLTADISALEAFLGAPGSFEKEPKKFEQAARLLEARRAALSAAEDEWLELEALKESLEG